MPPVWAIAAIIILGWNEFFALLRSPLWLLFGLLLFLFAKVRFSVMCSRACWLHNTWIGWVHESGEQHDRVGRFLAIGSCCDRIAGRGRDAARLW